MYLQFGGKVCGKTFEDTFFNKDFLPYMFSMFTQLQQRACGAP